MNGRYILDENGDLASCPDLMTWANWFATRSNVVARTELPNGITVSTIFLGLDYAWGYGRERKLFETMIFFGDAVLYGPDRYPDWPRAAEHHLELVRQWADRTPAE